MAKCIKWYLSLHILYTVLLYSIYIYILYIWICWFVLLQYGIRSLLCSRQFHYLLLYCRMVLQLQWWQIGRNLHRRVEWFLRGNKPTEFQIWRYLQKNIFKVSVIFLKWKSRRFSGKFTWSAAKCPFRKSLKSAILFHPTPQEEPPLEEASCNRIWSKGDFLSPFASLSPSHSLNVKRHEIFLLISQIHAAGFYKFTVKTNKDIDNVLQLSASRTTLTQAERCPGPYS